MNDVIEQPSSALATIQPTNLVAAFTKKDGIEAIVAAVEVEARAQAAALDVTKPKDRKAITSLAYKIAQSKVVLDDTGKDLGEAARKTVNAINEDRRLGRDRLEALQAEVRAPLVRFEQIEKDRVAAHEAALAEIEILATTDGLTADEINARIWSVPALEDRSWQDFETRALRVITLTTERLKTAHNAAVIHEQEAVEQERLRQAEAERIAAENERKRVEREAQIAADAAERARREAEAKAKREADEVAAAAQVERDAAARREREAAEALARQQRETQEAEERAAAALAKARADAKAAQERAEREREEATARAKREADAAVERERQRVAAEEATRKAEEERRAANLAHRRKINRDAMTAFVGAGLTEEQATTAVTAIAKGEIAHISISY